MRYRLLCVSLWYYIVSYPALCLGSGYFSSLFEFGFVWQVNAGGWRTAHRGNETVENESSIPVIRETPFHMTYTSMANPAI